MPLRPGIEPASGVPNESPHKGVPIAEGDRYLVRKLEPAISMVPVVVFDRVDVRAVDGDVTDTLVVERVEYRAGPLVDLVQTTIDRGTGVVQHTGTAESVRARCAVDADPRDITAIDASLNKP